MWLYIPTDPLTQPQAPAPTPAHSPTPPSPSFPALKVLASASIYRRRSLDLTHLARCVTWNGKSPQPESLSRGLRTGPCARLQCGVMSQPLMEEGWREWLTWFTGDFPARTCPWPENEPEWTGPKVGSGGSTPESLKRPNQDSCSLKTCRVCSQPQDKNFDAYAAGLIDGEGSITVRCDSKKSRYTVLVQMTLAAKATALLNALMQAYGGSVMPRAGRKETESATVHWQISNKSVICILRRLRPYIRLKAPHVETCIQLLETEFQTYNGMQRVTPERVALFQRAKAKLEKLNLRGPQKLESSYIAQLVGNRWMRRKMSPSGEQWETYSQRLPNSGSMRNGVLRERMELVLRMDGNEYGSWPTARGSDGEKGGPKQRGRRGDLMLPSAAAQWPSLTTAMTHGAGVGGREGGMNLQTAVEHWATPQAHDATPGNAARVRRYGTKHGGRNLTDDVAAWASPASRDFRTPNLKPYAQRGGGTKGEQLANQVVHSFPHSPRSSRPAPPTGLLGSPSSLIVRTLHRLYPPPRPGSQHLRLNPNFVDWLMGWPVGWTNASHVFAPGEMESWRLQALRHLCICGIE